MPYVNGRVPSASPYSRDAVDFWNSRGVNTLPIVEASERRQRNSRLTNRIALSGVGMMTGASLAPLFGGGGGGLGIPGYTPGWEGNSSLLFGGTGGGAGGGMTLGRIFGSRGFEAGVNGLTSIMGMRSQNNANRYATDANSRLMADQIRLEEARIRKQDEIDAADRADAERRWAAEEEWRRKQHEASEEERAYTRRLSEEREGRRAAYRPYRDSALRTLGSLLRIG